MADLPEDISEEAYIPQKLLAAILGGAASLRVQHHMKMTDWTARMELGLW